MLKGAIHVHSTYSDGEFTLPELREIFLAGGCAFVCITDHAESFTQRKLENYISECEALSDNRFRFVPGLEFECTEKMHILGYGVVSRVDTVEPQEVIRHIESKGGVSVIAHPKSSAFAWIERFRTLPKGIETWNTKYDGRYAPRPSTFHLLMRLQQRNSEIRAFYGQDFHYKSQFHGLLTQAYTSILGFNEVLRSLAAGAYVGQRDDLVLPSSGIVPDRLLERFARVHWRYDPARNALHGLKNVVKRAGFQVPSAFMAQARRFFL